MRSDERQRAVDGTGDADGVLFEGFLDGRYDCVDRVVLGACFELGQRAPGFRTWRRRWQGWNDGLKHAAHAGGGALRPPGEGLGEGCGRTGGVQPDQRTDRGLGQGLRPRRPGLRGRVRGHRPPCAGQRLGHRTHDLRADDPADQAECVVGGSSVLGRPSATIDPDWRERIEIAKRVRDETRKARGDKPSTFDMRGPPIRIRR